MKDIILALITNMSASFAFSTMVVAFAVTVPPLVYYYNRRERLALEYRHREELKKLENSHQEQMFTLNREHPIRIGESKVIEE